MTRTTPAHRGAALSLALAASAAVAAPSAAFAATDQALPAPGDTSSLTVTSMVNGDTSTSPEQGVCFTMAPVEGVDLTTAAGWKDAAAYTDSTDVPVHVLGDTIPLPATGADGSATKTDIPTGLYQVHAQGFNDFYVTLPMSDGSGGLTHTVTAYPKHTVPPTDVPVVPNGICPQNPPPINPTSSTPAIPQAVVPAPLRTPTPTPTPSPSPNGGQTAAAPNGGQSASGPRSGDSAASPQGGNVIQSPWGGGGLAYTGAEVMGPLGVALSAILTGLGFVLLTRRRRRGEEEPQPVRVTPASPGRR